MIRTRYYVGLVTRHGERVPYRVKCETQRAVADAYEGGCTVYPVEGYWRGDKEPSMILEVCHEGTLPVEPHALAGELAKLAEQSQVMWTEERINGGFAP